MLPADSAAPDALGAGAVLLARRPLGLRLSPPSPARARGRG